jgi:hypothetical protein
MIQQIKKWRTQRFGLLLVFFILFYIGASIVFIIVY